MTRDEKRKYRADLFRHLDGLVTAPVAHALHQRGVLDLLLTAKELTLDELVEELAANQGYLNVALHTLASQGWLNYSIDGEQIRVSLTEKSEIAFALAPLYQDVVDLVQLSGRYHPRKFERAPFEFLETIVEKYQGRCGLAPSSDPLTTGVQDQVLKHIEGMIVGPTAVALGMSGMFHKYFMEASFRPEEFHNDGASFARLLDVFVFLEWFEKRNETYRFTEKGLFYARRASAYGVTVSYLPMFRKIDDLIFGDPGVLWDVAPGSAEIHVDREMNVWGSGGAHSSYFKVVDQIIIDLFNQPIERQPRGIVDMGCGNGAFLIHLYEVIEQRTQRGKMLEEHPLFLVGADYNEAALKVSRTNIIQANIWAKFIWGDIGRPDLLTKELHENYGIDLKDLLNVRTFLDHNRIWSEPTSITPDRTSTSTGAFAHRGNLIAPRLVEDNLKEHFQKWSPYVDKYGLLLIELHTISPALTAENIGKTAATAYNATHGFSDQYILEIDSFLKVAAEAGLHTDEAYFTKFPNSDLASVSINLFRRHP